MSLETAVLRQIRAQITIQHYEIGNLYKRLFIYALFLYAHVQCLWVHISMHAYVFFFFLCIPVGNML